MRSLSEVVLALPGRGDLGGADCEQVRDAVLAQPVAAVSSLGYVAVGGYLAWAWSGLPGGERRVARTYAGILVLVGAGSVLYPGPHGPAAEVLHDVPLVVLLTGAVAVPAARALHRRQVLRPGAARRLVVAGVAGGVAAVAYVAGRTGSPLCDPQSLLQAHGLWHLASAVALGAWGAALWPSPASASGTTQEGP